MKIFYFQVYENFTTKIQSIASKIFNKKIEEKIPLEKEEVKPVSKDVVCSLKCPYHSFEGAITEFVVGVAVGITIAVALSIYL